MFVNDTKYNCGIIIPSSCVPYQNPKTLTLLEEDQELPCDANINDVIDLFDQNIKKLKDDSDFKLLDKKCLIFDPLTINNKQLHQLEIDNICGLSARITTLEDAKNNFKVGEEPITIDLGALSPIAEPCKIADNTYKLITVLNILVDEINSLKQQIAS